MHEEMIEGIKCQNCGKEIPEDEVHCGRSLRGWMRRQFLSTWMPLSFAESVPTSAPVRAFRMAVKEKVPDTGKNTTDNVAEDVPMTETA